MNSVTSEQSEQSKQSVQVMKKATKQSKKAKAVEAVPEAVEKAPKKTRTVNVEKITSAIKASCGVFLPVSKCEAVVLNEVIHPEASKILANLESCKKINAGAVASDTADGAASEAKVVYDFSGLTAESKLYISESYKKFNEERKEVFAKEKVKQWEKASDVRVSRLRDLEEKSSLVEAALQVDAQFFADFKYEIEVHRTRANEHIVVKYTSADKMPDSDKYTFYKKLIKMNKVRISEVAKTTMTIFTEQVLKSLISVSLVNCMIAKKKMLGVEYASVPFSQVAQQSALVKAIVDAELMPVEAATKYVENQLFLLPVAANLRSYQQALHAALQVDAEAAEATESDSSEGGDIEEKEQGSQQASQSCGARRPVSFINYINRIVDAVKYDLDQASGVAPYSLHVKTAFKQLCCEVIQELLVKTGKLMKSEVESRVVKTVNGRIVHSAITSFLVHANLEELDFSSKYEEYKCLRGQQKDEVKKKRTEAAAAQ
jgi:hypothetical protein